jgi:integrase
MAIHVKCPVCKVRFSYKKKKCRNCGEMIDPYKRAKKLTYYVVFRYDGIQKVKSAGKDFQKAKALDAKLCVAKYDGSLKDFISKKEMTFNQVASWYYDLPSVQNISYIKDLRLYSNHFLKEYGEYNVMNIKSENIEAFQYQKKAEGYSDSYIDKMVSSIYAMVKKAVYNDLIPSRATIPFVNISKFLRKNSNARNRVLSRSEYDLIYQNLGNHLKPVFATAYWTGMRKNEILTLTWDRVNLSTNLIYLRSEDTKDKEERWVYIPEPLVKVFSELVPKAKGYVFTFRGKPISDIRTGLKLACNKAGVKYGQRQKGGFVFHDLRHTFNTNARKAGVSESVIMKMTGHSTREMFDRYNTVDFKDLSSASNQLSNFLERI